MALWAIQVSGVAWGVEGGLCPFLTGPRHDPVPQVIVAMISFLETMLLIYLSYKVSEGVTWLALPYLC